MGAFTGRNVAWLEQRGDHDLGRLLKFWNWDRLMLLGAGDPNVGSGLRELGWTAPPVCSGGQGLTLSDGAALPPALDQEPPL